MLNIRNKNKKNTVLLLAAMLSISNLAWADAQDTLNFSVGAAARFDDNLFRQPDASKQSSDRIYTTNAGVKIDKRYAQQRFQVDAGVVDNRYRSNDFLDYTAFNYRAAWLWHLTPSVSGMLMADQQQVANSFTDFRDTDNKPSTKLSIQTNESRVFNADALIGGGWHLLGGVSEIRSRNSQAFDVVGDYVQRGGELGIKYVAPSENWISLIQRTSKGDYGRVADFATELDSGFDQKSTDVRVNWQLTGKSTIDAQLGYVDREHNNFSSRDYDGATGRLTYIWTPTGKLRINTSVSRNLSSYQQAINSYYVVDTFSLSPVWQMSAKTSLRLSYDYSQRKYLGAIVVPSEKRKDEGQSLMLAADWQPTRNITVTGALQREVRNSNFDNRNSVNGDLTYDVNAATINAQFLF